MIKFEEYDYYIKPGCTDLRKGALKLSLIVQDEMELNPFTKSIFMVCSKNRKTIYLRQLSLIDCNSRLNGMPFPIETECCFLV